jgi:hypothetical protein
MKWMQKNVLVVRFALRIVLRIALPAQGRKFILSSRKPVLSAECASRNASLMRFWFLEAISYWLLAFSR